MRGPARSSRSEASAAQLRAAGCDVVDVSSGQVWPDQRPAYGRSYQTPFADRIRNEAGIPTIALVFGNSTAGGAYVPGMSDHVVMVDGGAVVSCCASAGSANSNAMRIRRINE